MPKVLLPLSDWLADLGVQTVPYGGSELTLQEVAVIATTLPAIQEKFKKMPKLREKLQRSGGRENLVMMVIWESIMVLLMQLGTHTGVL